MPTIPHPARRAVAKLTGVVVLVALVGGLPVAARGVRVATVSAAAVLRTTLHLRPAAWFGGCGDAGSVCPIGAAVYPSVETLARWCARDADGVKSCRI